MTDTKTTPDTAAASGVNAQSAAGKAYQSVAQSAAIAIQDATDNLRNINTISTTALGVAMSQMLSDANPDKWLPVIQAAQEMVKQGASDFERIGATAAQVLRSFPAGDGPAGE